MDPFLDLFSNVSSRRGTCFISDPICRPVFLSCCQNKNERKKKILVGKFLNVLKFEIVFNKIRHACCCKKEEKTVRSVKMGPTQLSCQLALAINNIISVYRISTRII